MEINYNLIAEYEDDRAYEPRVLVCDKGYPYLCFFPTFSRDYVSYDPAHPDTLTICPLPPGSPIDFQSGSAYYELLRASYHTGHRQGELDRACYIRSALNPNL